MVDGLRIDHPDGLADPAGYLERLAERGVERIWVEKIIEPGELLPDWPVEGTAGYVIRAPRPGSITPPAEEPLDGAVRGADRETRPFEDLGAEAKLEEARTTSSPRWTACGRCSTSPRWPRRSPRCRSTAPTWSPTEAENDPHDVEAVEEAGLPERVREALVAPADSDEEAFAVRFQQTTGAVMAKGVEDTALYRYTRLVALRRGGRRPGPLSISPPGCTRPTRSARSASRGACWPPRRTTPSARATCGRASARCRGWPASGASGCCAGVR